MLIGRFLSDDGVRHITLRLVSVWLLLATYLPVAAPTLAQTLAGEAEAVEQRGWMLLETGDPRSAITDLEQAIALYQRRGFWTGVVPSQRGLADAYEALGELDRALDYYDRALRSAQGAGTPRSQWMAGPGFTYTGATEALAWLGIGRINNRRAWYYQALEALAGAGRRAGRMEIAVRNTKSYS